MKTYRVEIVIRAEDENELAEKLQAFQDIQDNMQHEDLITAVEIIIENPEIIDFIKQTVPKDGRKLSWGDYLRIAKDAWVKFG